MRKLILAIALIIPATLFGADSAVVVSSGTGTNIDAFTIGSDYRQAVVIGDSAIAGGVAPVDSVGGLRVNLGTSTAVIGVVQSTVTVTRISEALPTGDNNVGNVDIVTMPAVTASNLDIRDLAFASDRADVTGSTVTLSNPTVAVTQSGTWTVQPGNTANTTAWKVDGSAVTQPVSGTVTANAGTGLFNTTGSTVTISNSISVSVTGSTITVSSIKDPLPTGTNSIGQVTANAGTNLNTSSLALEATQADNRTALQIIDDWDESDRAKVNPIAGQAGVAANIGASSALTQRMVLANDQPSFGTHASTSIVNTAGGFVVYTSTFANVAQSQTAQGLVGAVASTRIRVVSAVAITGGTATNVTFNSASTAISPLFATGANTGFMLPFNPAGWFETLAGETLTVTTGAGSTVGILINYLKI